MATKRVNLPDDQSDSKSLGVSSPAAKKPRLITFEPIRLPTISTVSDLDKCTLAFQNRKLAERLEQKKRVERDLRLRIEKLEQRQNRDDVFLCVVNRHWNRLDEDVRILLQRFDSEADVEEVENVSESTSSFLTLLSQWDQEELDGQLTQRVEFSKRDIAKLVKAFDRLSHRNTKLAELLNASKGASDKSENGENATKDLINAELLINNSNLRKENERLQLLASKLQEKNHALSNNNSRMKDRLSAAETKLDEYKKELEESDFQLEKALSYTDKLEYQLKEMAGKLQRAELSGAVPDAQPAVQAGQPTSAVDNSSNGSNKSGSVIDKNKVSELSENLEEQREMASGRLAELQELMDKHVKALQTIEQLKSEFTHVPEEIILKSTQYCRMQTQFSVLYNESVQCRSQLEDIRNQLIATKVAHLKQIEQMESEELLAQKRLRAEMVQLEDQLSQVRREYEMLRVEFEQNLAANEQSGPLNKEMRQLLASYKVQNGQFRSEVQRFKRKWREAVSTIAKVQKELDTERKSHENCIHVALTQIDDSEAAVENSEKAIAELEKSGDLKTSPSDGDDDDEAELSDEIKKMDTTELRKYVRRLQKKCSELDIALQAYKQATGEAPARAEAFKRLKQENVQLRFYICCVARKRGKDTLPSVEEPNKHFKKLEDQIDKLKKEIAGCKQEEETLLNEMEVTGQAFEEMQEQNVRLVQQLKEKDDANFKLMSDRIKTNQQHKLLREEKDLLHDQVTALQNQIEAQNLVVRKLEEKENLLQQQLTTSEKEMTSRQQATDLHRRKAIEMTQSLADLKLQVEKLSAQLNEAQQAIAAKTAGLEEESFKIARLQEEISAQRKRLERSKKYEKASGATDQILLEEIRELKEHLTCPSCKVRRKDGVLTKCYHVFCMDCLKTRYETRQRKCPKCNAAFGANDFKRIYIS